MKLLLFSDVHCNQEACQDLVGRSEQVDCVVAAGDLGTKRQGLDKVIPVLSQIEKPTVVVPGNAESVEELREACARWASAQVLHGAGTSILGVEFFGIGGGIPATPYGAWSYDFSEEEAAQLLAACPSECVLVSHSPPQSCVDMDSSGRSLGSQSLHHAIVEKHPRLFVCGHVHASWQRIEFIDRTPVVNAGPQGVIWDLSAACRVDE